MICGGARRRLPRLLLSALALLFALALSPHAAAGVRLAGLRSRGRKCFGTTPCTMLLDRDGAIGCGQCTAPTVAEPVLELTQRQDLLNFLTPPVVGNFPRALLIPELLFYDKAVLSKLPHATNVASVVVYEGFRGQVSANSTVTDLSSDEVIPNQRFSVPPTNVSYNRRGLNSSQFRSFYPFNIFRVSAAVAAEIRAEAQSTADSVGASFQPTVPNLLRRQYRLESNGQMYACPADAAAQRDASSSNTSPGNLPGGFKTLNSSACLRGRTCRPVGGQSIWSSLGVLQPSSAPPKVIAVTAPFDSMAFFHDLAYGASAEVASLATLMAVAEAVGAYRNSDAGRSRPMLRQPVYFAFNAQSWGFAGSSRFLDDVLNFKCKTPGNVKKSVMGCLDPYMSSLKFKDLQNATFSVINLGGLVNPLDRYQALDPGAAKPPSNNLFYVQGQTRAASDTSTFDALLSGFKRLSNVSIENGSRAVPPDASQSFDQYLPGVESLSITNYPDVFSNRYYHSQYDKLSLIPPHVRSPLVLAATGVAKAVINLAFDDAAPNITINSATIDGFIDCFTSNWNETGCNLSLQYQGVANYNRNARYVSPTNYAGAIFPYSRASQFVPGAAFKADLISHFLAYQNRFKGGGECKTIADCQGFANDLNANATTQSELRRVFCSRGVCIAADAFPHDAFGTAINSVNADRSAFEVSTNVSSTNRFTEKPQWTESDWGTIELCGKTVDSSSFGGLILGVGLAVNLFSLLVAGLVHYCYLRTKKVELENEPPRGLASGV